MAENKRPVIFDRLAGLETEYGIRCPNLASSSAPSKYLLYQSLVEAVRRRVLTVPARQSKEGVFTANGGAIWFECERPAAGGGLIEGATPECRGPQQLLIYQRAQDQLLSEAAEAGESDGAVRLIKNDRDAQDHIYGAQENYEVILATGWRLLVWRAGVIMLSPLVLLTWLGCLALLISVLLYFAAAGLVYLVIRRRVRHPQQWALAMFGRDLVEGRSTGAPSPPWLEAFTNHCSQLVSAPLAVALLLLARVTAFAPIRRQLLPFLVSRPIVAGSGMVDRSGNFHLADKAPAMNRVLGYGGLLGDRPIFTIGPLFKALCLDALDAIFAPRDYFDLLGERHRFQIGLGDSNMADVAEYLRIGTTMLVLDAIEAGQFEDAPRLSRPVRALHAICADPTLQTRVKLVGGRQWTAIELQRYYLEGCRRFVASRPEAPPAAHDVLKRWAEVLDQLEHVPQQLIGSLDWVTKKYLLDKAGSRASWQVRKKIDIRYHELSAEGYFQLLKRAGLTVQLVSPGEIERAIRTSPADTPATTRGHYIREFAPGSEQLAVNWKNVVIGQGRTSRTIRLARYRRSGATSA